MQAWEEKFDGELATMVSTINLDTDKYVKVANDAHKNSNCKHHYGYGVPTLKSRPTSYNTTFGHHPPTIEEHYLNSKPLRDSQIHHQPTIITKAITSIMSSSLPMIGENRRLVYY